MLRRKVAQATGRADIGSRELLSGEFAGIQPKGNLIRCPAISTFRVENGKLAEAWEIFDSGSLFQQMKA